MYYENDCVLCIRYVSVFCVCISVCVCVSLMYLIHYKFFEGTFVPLNNKLIYDTFS